jgi:hypothetical protein
MTHQHTAGRRRAHAPEVTPPDDPLELAKWEMLGYRASWVTFTRPVVPGPLIIAHDGVSSPSAHAGCYLKGVSLANVRVTVEQLIKGWPGTETSGLPATWQDNTTHIITEIEATGTTITTRAKIVGAGTWAHEQIVTGDTDIAGPGHVGLQYQNLIAGMSIEIHAFTYVPL